MKIGWQGRLSDEEYVDKIRRTYQGAYRWKWWIAGFSALILGIYMAMWALTARIAFSDLIINPPAPFNTYAQGLGNGFVIGFLVAFTLPAIVISVPSLIMELRTWRLLLDYHDRLQQAGLLNQDTTAESESQPAPSTAT